jgi:carbon storage regulator CsrA
MEIQKVIVRRKTEPPPQQTEPKPTEAKEKGFLCLTRKPKPNQNTILINDGEIEIQVISVQGGAVRLGFRATKDFRIDRPETKKRVL